MENSQKYLEHGLFLSQIQLRQMGYILQQLFWCFNIKLVQTPVSDLFHTWRRGDFFFVLEIKTIVFSPLFVADVTQDKT